MNPPRYVVIANPDSLRWQRYEPELRGFWAERGGAVEIEVVPWAEVVPRDGNLDGLAAFDRPALVRLESPGRDWDVAKMLLAAGSRAVGADESPWLAVPYQKGRQVRPGLFYAGFRRVLRGLKESFDLRAHLTPLCCPLEVAEMFDKNATCARLVAAEIPTPVTLPPPASSVELLQVVRQHRFDPAYVKLNTGSSVSAIAVLHALHDEPWATTSLAVIDGEFYSTRRLRRSIGAELESVLDFLIREGVSVQQGIRMAKMDGQNFDVRVIVIRGRVAFAIFRLSPNPMTNLHLGGQRGDPARCRAAIPKRVWLDAMDHCLETAALYRAESVGIDLLFENGYFRYFILEVNAFGDFFPNLVDDRGRSVARVEVEESARMLGL